INTYWEDIRDSGQTDGCSAAQPTIPTDYALPEGTTIENQTLELVIELVNTGLGLTRQGWTQFNTACNSSNPLDFVEAGLQSARSALASFELARDQLNTLVGS
ncbi:MAG: hypothetical protein K8L99_13705, partial [Anaerolineae bacterium]|nr:hypothetical protein [Anaerolineae bacterium]